eukprot:IDg61t1
MTMPNYAQDTESESSVSDDDAPTSTAMSPTNQLDCSESTMGDEQSAFEFISGFESDGAACDDEEAEKRS